MQHTLAADVAVCERDSMPRFSANLSFLFTELPFLDRFAAAAHAGFRAVEFAFAYEYPPREIAARLAANGLAQCVNAPPGEWRATAGSRRCGREHVHCEPEPRYATPKRSPARVHVMAGSSPRDPTPRRAHGSAPSS
jgi:hydroxypyruvate isomerase